MIGRGFISRCAVLTSIAAAAAGWTMPARASVSTPPPIDLAANPAALRGDVPTPYRPKFRWWWPSAYLDHAEIDRELDAIKNAGFGGVEETLLRSGHQWWEPAFRESIRAALTKSNEIGLRFDTTFGPGWPMSSRAVDDFSKGLSMQEITSSAVELNGPHPYVGPVPPSAENGARAQKLVGLVAARTADQGDTGLPVPIAPAGSRTLPPIILDPASAIDLTGQVQDGTLTWNVPSGRWVLVAIYQRATGQRSHGDVAAIAGGAVTSNLPADAPDIGDLQSPLVPDEYSRAATKATLGDYTETLFGGDMAALFRRNGGDVFEDSLELLHGDAGGIGVGEAAPTSRFWTPSLPAEFRKRRGYDIAKYLPVLFADFDFPGDAGERVRNDFDETMKDLIVENHYRAIARWANSIGLRSRAQGYNLSEADRLDVSLGIQDPDDETIDAVDNGAGTAPGSDAARAVIDHYRSVASAAHLTGAHELSLEADALSGDEYGVTVQDYKASMDRAFASGLSTLVVHGFAYKDFQDPYQTWGWPGWSAFDVLYSQSWNENFPELPLWRPAADYFARIGAALRNGTPKVDLTVLSQRLDSSGRLYGTADTAGALDGSSYSWDRITDPALAGLPKPEDGEIMPSGPAYRAVVVDGMPAVSAATAERLLALAQAGEPVVIKGDTPQRGTSYADAKAEDARVKRAFAALLALPDVRHVTAGADVVKALAALGVEPRMQTTLPLVSQHRVTPGGDVWFLYNNSAKAVSSDVAFASHGAPTQIDPVSGQATPLGAYVADARTVTLPISLPAGGTTLISFGRGGASRLHATAATGEVVYDGAQLVLRSTSGGPQQARLSSGRTVTPDLGALPAPQELTAPWKLAVDTVGPDGDGKVDLTLDKLDDWANISQLAGAAGTGVYTTSFSLPAGWLAAGRGVMLDPGAVGGRFTVEVNGKAVPFGNPADGPRDITPQLHEGENSLRVTLATPILNELVSRAKNGDAHYAPFAYRSALPLGLIGPVKLVPFATTRLAQAESTNSEESR